jgi:hypothetical protein
VRVSRDSRALLAVGAVFLVCGLLFLAIGVPISREQYLQGHSLVRRGVFASGIVLGKSRSETGDWTGLGYTYRYEVSYRFETPRGERYVDKAEVDAMTWDGLTERGPITVRYLTEAPQHHSVRGQRGNWVVPIMLTAIGALFASLGCALAGFGLFRSRIRRSHRVAGPPGMPHDKGTRPFRR